MSLRRRSAPDLEGVRFPSALAAAVLVVGLATSSAATTSTPTPTPTPIPVPIGGQCNDANRCNFDAACVMGICVAFTFTPTRTSTFTPTATPTLIPIGGGCTSSSQCFFGSACVANTCTAFTHTGTPTRTPTPPPTATRTRTATLSRTRTPTRTPTRSGRSLSINDVGFSEGRTAPMFFTVTLSQAANVEVRVDYAPADGSAKADLDYFATPATLVFSPGQTQQRIFFTLRNDTVPEPNETFFMNLTRPFNASIGRGQGVATIIDDDTVGTLELEPLESSVDPDDLAIVTLRWAHPVNWRGLETVDLRVSDGDETTLWIRFDEAANTFALCAQDEECGPGDSPGAAAVLRADGGALHLERTEVRGSGPTGPSVELVYAISLEPSLAGRELRIDAAATDDDGERQDFAEVGVLLIVESSEEQGGGCSATTPAAPTGGSGLALLPVLIGVWLRRRLTRFGR